MYHPRDPSQDRKANVDPKIYVAIEFECIAEKKTMSQPASRPRSKNLVRLIFITIFKTLLKKTDTGGRTLLGVGYSLRRIIRNGGVHGKEVEEDIPSR